MKYGLDIPPFGPFGDAKVLADLAVEAEQAGWDGFFIWDHIAREWQLDIVDPWVALTAIALRTERIRFGPLVTPLARRRPWKVARETVSIDRLSDGRLILGVGLGSGSPTEWDAFGEETQPRARGQMLDEALAVLDGLWSGERFSFEGAYYRVDEARFLPTPAQTPRVPVWVGGYWPNKPPFRRAARWDGVFPLAGERGDLTPEQVVELRAYIDAHRTSDRSFDVVYRREPTHTLAPERRAALVASFAEAGATWWLEAIHPWFFSDNWEAMWPVEAMRDRIRMGPPAE